MSKSIKHGLETSQANATLKSQTGINSQRQSTQFGLWASEYGSSMSVLNRNTVVALEAQIDASVVDHFLC